MSPEMLLQYWQFAQNQYAMYLNAPSHFSDS